MESQEGGVPDVGMAGREVPVYTWHQHTDRGGVLMDGVEQEEVEPEKKIKKRL